MCLGLKEYGTLKQKLVKFKNTQVTEKINRLDHIEWHRRYKSLTF